MENILENRVNKAKELFTQGYNCAQSVFIAFADMYNISEEMAMKMTLSLGSGMGGLKQTCGAATAIFLLAGLETEDKSLTNRENMRNTYKLVRSLAAELVKVNGSIVCGQLLETNSTRKRTCNDTVEETARVWGEYLVQVGKLKK
jgi:C_GCAxxG_C_C family probable redox protein